jgi:hypothetical protein
MKNFDIFLKTVSLVISTAVLIAHGGGCGYSFRADGKPVGIEMESLAIPMISSTSSNPGFESDFTDVLRREFISQAQVPIVPEGRAHMVLTGSVYDIITEPLTYNVEQRITRGYLITDETTRSRRLKIKVDMKLTERSTGRVIWHEPSMEEKAEYVVDTDPLVTEHGERQALREIAGKLAERIYLKTVERF